VGLGFIACYFVVCDLLHVIGIIVSIVEVTELREGGDVRGRL